MKRIYSRIQNFRKRNEGIFFRKTVEQITAKIWIDLKLWRFFSIFFPTRLPETWVFMGGCYNSGTTILREIIGSHPSVATLPREGTEMTDAFPDLEQNGWVRMWFKNNELAEEFNRNPNKRVERGIRHWSIWWKKGSNVFLEKSIAHAAWMPALDRSLKNARFIGVVRNGLCVCEGIQRRAKPVNLARTEIGTDTYPLHEVAQQWLHSNQILQRDKQLIKNYYEIRYEEFTQKPVEQIKSLFKFIGVDESVVWKNHDGSIQVGKRRFEIINHNKSSLSRLSPTEKDELWSVIGPMMKNLSYATSSRN